MKKIYIIGTLHGNCTPKNELEDILENLQPNQLMIEISQKDIENKNFKNYPDEMVFGYNWAQKNKILVFGFDSDISELAKGKTDQDNQTVMDLQKEIIDKYDWKDFNKEEYLKLLDVPGAKKLVDKERAKQREQEMLKNIQRNLASEGTIAILTGCGHLDFFEKEIPEAIFPLK